MAVDVDANIVDLFGPLPEGIDLEENYADTTDMANIALIAIALLSVILRFGARAVQKAGFKADDYLVIVALVSASTSLLTFRLFFLYHADYVRFTCFQKVSDLTRIFFSFSAAVYCYVCISRRK